MSTNALTLALVFGILFAISDRMAMHIGDRFGRNYGSVVWAILVMTPAIVLAMLNLMAAGVAVLAGVCASYALSKIVAHKARRNADPFAQPHPSLRWHR